MKRLLALLLSLPLLALATIDLRFEKDGAAIFENELIKVTFARHPGHAYGIYQWFFKPTGYEMVNVLYGQTDYVEGHVLGERWDHVEKPGLISSSPDTGSMYIPVEFGISDDGAAARLVQEARGSHTLRRTIVMRRDLATLEVSYDLLNRDAPTSLVALRFHSAWSPGARGPYQRRDDTIHLATTTGILALDQALNNEQYRHAHEWDKFFYADWMEEPRRSWTRPNQAHATLADSWAAQVNRTHGDGMVFVMQPDGFMGYYNCPGITLEPVYRPVALSPGESWSTVVHVGAFSGAKDRQIVGATPIYLLADPLTLQNGRLTATLLPTFAGTLLVRDGDTEAARLTASPDTPLPLDAAVAGPHWSIEALDRHGLSIGLVRSDGSFHLRQVNVRFEPPARPPVADRQVIVAPEDEAHIAAFLAQRDHELTVVCPHDSDDAIKQVAREIADRLGLGLAWTDIGGRQIVVGSTHSQLIRDIGQLTNSLSAEWPGAGKGAILHFPNVELTQAPMVLIGGTGPAGTLAAAQRFIADHPGSPRQTTGFHLWASRPDRKLFPYSRPLPDDPATIEIWAAKGEYELAQIAITAFEQLKEVEIVTSPLIHQESGEVLSSAKEITRHRKLNGPLWVRWVDYFPIDRQDGWAGFPDPLFEQAVTPIQPGATQPLWLTFIVPETAAPGTYTSTLTATANGVSHQLPLTLHVWDFTIPRDGLKGEPYMDMAALNLHQVTRELRDNQLRDLISNLVEHGMRVIHLGPTDMFRWHFSPDARYSQIDFDWLTCSDDGTMALDASRFDELIAWCDQAAKPFQITFMLYARPLLDKGYGDFRRAFPKRFDQAPERPDTHWYAQHYAEAMLRVYRKHLEKRGLLDRVVLKLADEPPGFSYWYNRFTEAARNVGVPIMTCFNSIDWEETRGFEDKVSLWQPLYMHYDPEVFARFREAGAQISWYNCGPPPRITNAVPAGELRGYLWQAAKADLDVVAWWGIQNWGYYNGSEALWRDRYSHWNTVTYPPHPTRKPWMKPGKSWVDSTIIDSIRWEMIREGMEDAWYVNELRNRIANARDNGNDNAADKAEQVLHNLWQSTFPTLNHYAPPYPSIMHARRTVAETILDLDPRK